MFEWLPTYTTDIYIQRQISGNDIRFHVTFIRKHELNGQIVITDKQLSGIIALRNLLRYEPKEELGLDRLFVHL